MTTEQKQIVKQCVAEYQAGLQYRHQREAAWKLAEDQYFNKQAKSLKHRYNVPVPIVPGFVETLLSKIDDPPTLKFGQVKDSDYRAAKKVTALYSQDKDREDYDWDMVDIDGKKQAILYGRPITKNYAVSIPEYKFSIDPVDVYDFIASAFGGGNTEKHLYLQQDNLFKNREDMKFGVEKLGYDKEGVETIINATKAEQLVNNDNMFRSKQSRFMALGLDGLTYNYAGQDLYKFIEAGTTWKGKRYYVLFSLEMQAAIVCEPLSERFKSNLWPWTSWATHRDIFNFWSKAPVDDIVPLADMVRILVNQELDNRQKKNWGQRAYDPDIFPEPSELEFRPDGLVKTKSGLGVKKISDGVYQFETPELNGTINLVQWIDGILGQKTGVTADTQGQSDEDKVGIYYGNLQQVADRLGLYNKSYKKYWQANGRRYVWGLYEHLRSPMAVKMIGEKGEEWDEIKRTEVEPTWSIKVEGGNAELQADEIKKKAIVETLGGLQPDELAVTSAKWRVEAKLRAAGQEEDEIIRAFDLSDETSREVLSKASQMIQDCLAGKPYKPYRGATTAFLQKILDYATDTDGLSQDEYDKLMEIAEAHTPIAIENAARKAVKLNAQRGIPPAQLGASQEMVYNGAIQNTPQATASQTSNQPIPQATQV